MTMTKTMMKMMKMRRTRKKNHQKWMKTPLIPTKSPKSQNPKKPQEKGPKVYPSKVNKKTCRIVFKFSLTIFLNLRYKKVKTSDRWLQ